MVGLPVQTSFCGAFPLPMGIVAALFWISIRTGFMLCYFSSSEDVMILGITVSATAQIVIAATALLGVPLVVLAGFGAVFRIEKHVGLLFQWFVFTLVIDVLGAGHIVIGGRVCSSLSTAYMMRQGPMFVCLFLGLGTMFWLAVVVLTEAYLTYVVWCQAEVLKRGEYAELLSYDAKMMPGLQVL
mmetsp:Transcript_57986/g.164763  ORF Transcript_57986/g.164763 Transcript_57986/m.164763 type:complete len:185 (+) Transcript_57986:112-666(+)|eukprot:CAMPEP_0168457876 /NCGR_PEP_ID=MMETSP0228-20121227/52083_1 /TAXON_ID=133427 /ORGANISM="Protoceratium reticulatum, Strain CCCM 535 (=CCMP 1889)" /LENGTH=184 /DNA_ID=CAMNT_0008472949 /DNA_START=95 /DNA_END=649 /DNA_ORIENTATION=+